MLWAGTKAALRLKSTPAHAEATLREVLRKNGALIVDNMASDVLLIVDSFDAPDIRKAVSRNQDSLGSRIIGIDAVLFCDSTQRRLPLQRLPLLNYALHKVVVCCTQVPKEDREEVHLKVSFMGGKYVQQLQNDVTHLLVGTPEGDKFEKARLEDSITLVSPLWKRSKRVPTDHYLIPPFKGLIVSITGVSPTEARVRVQRKVEQGGGTFTPNMDNTCTHLVADPAGIKFNGDSKYVWARKWELKIVTVKWVDDCLEQKRRLLESLPIYEVNLTLPSHMKTPDESASQVSESSRSVDTGRPGGFFFGCQIFLSGFLDTEVKNFTRQIWEAKGDMSYEPSDRRITHFVVKIEKDDDITAYQAGLKGTDRSKPKPIVRSASNSHVIDTNQLHNELVEHQPNTQQPILLEPAMPRMFEDKLQEVTRKLYERGAKTITDNNLLGDCTINYIVSPHGCRVNTNTSRFKGSQLVSLTWLDACFEAGLVLDRNYNVCFTPLPFNLQKYAMFMKNLEICVSGYTKDERQHIGNFVSLMGAQFVVTLKAKTTTHLICKTPSGDKYESALNRNIKVVRKEWLDECAKRGYRVEEAEFSFFSGQHALGGGWVDSPPVAPAANEPMDSSEMHCESTGPKAARVNLQMLDAQSPLQPAVASPSAVPSLAAELLNIQPEDLSLSFEIQNYDEQVPTKDEPMDVEVVAHVPPAIAAPAVLANSSLPKVIGEELPYYPDCGDPYIGDGHEELMEVDRRETITKMEEENIIRTGPLSGVIAYIPKKLGNQVSELAVILNTLGGVYSWEFDDHVTHYIHEAKSESYATKELKRAKERRIHLVSPVWLHRCRSENRRVSETECPPLVNPKQALSCIVVAPSNSSITIQSKPPTSTPPTTVVEIIRGGPKPGSALPSSNLGANQKKRKQMDSATEKAQFPSPPSSPDRSSSKRRLSDISSTTDFDSHLTQSPAAGFSAPARSPRFRGNQDEGFVIPPPPITSPKSSNRLATPRAHPRSPSKLNLSQRLPDDADNPSNDAPVGSHIKSEPGPNQAYVDSPSHPSETEQTAVNVLEPQEKPKKVTRNLFEKLQQVVSTTEAEDVGVVRPATSVLVEDEQALAMALSRRVSRWELQQVEVTPTKKHRGMSAPEDSNSLTERDTANRLIMNPEEDSQGSQQQQHRVVYASQDSQPDRTRTPRHDRSAPIASRDESAFFQEYQNFAKMLDGPQSQPLTNGPETANPPERSPPRAPAQHTSKRIRSTPHPKANHQPAHEVVRVLSDSQEEEEAVSSAQEKSSASKTIPATPAASAANVTKANQGPKRSSISGNISVLLSAYKEETLKNQTRQKIETLGGAYSTDCPIREVTHVVALEVIRSPKMVAALCYGKWIVRPEWVEASYKAGYFVDEAPYEWAESPATKPGVAELENACGGCRKRVADAGGRGFFVNTPVILFIKNKSRQNRHMLEQCGFEVLQEAPPYKKEHLKRAELVFIDRDGAADPGATILLEQNLVPVVTTSYLSDFLLKGKADVRNYHPLKKP